MATTLLGELDTTPLVPARELGGSEVYDQALIRLAEVWQRQPEGLAEQVADALEPPTEEQHADIVRTLRPVVAEVRDRAAANMATAIAEIDRCQARRGISRRAVSCASRCSIDASPTRPSSRCPGVGRGRGRHRPHHLMAVAVTTDAGTVTTMDGFTYA